MREDRERFKGEGEVVQERRFKHVRFKGEGRRKSGKKTE